MLIPTKRDLQSVNVISGVLSFELRAVVLVLWGDVYPCIFCSAAHVYGYLLRIFGNLLDYEAGFNTKNTASTFSVSLVWPMRGLLD